MSTDLHDRLADLAQDAPASPYGGVEGLWRRGRRRRRLEVVGAAVAVVALLAVTGGLAGLVSRSSPQVVAPHGAVGLPDRFDDPSPWLPGTDGHPIGPVVAVVPALRNDWSGLATSSGPGFVAVSAVTGASRFLDLPGAAYDTDLAPSEAIGLSPDGRYVGYWLRGTFPDDHGVARSGVGGVAVYDTVTGSVDRHRVPSRRGMSPVEVSWADGAAWFRYGVVDASTSSTTSFTLVPALAVDVGTGAVRTTGLPADVLWTGADGRRLVALHGDEVSLWTSTGRPVRRFTVSRPVASARLSPAGDRLAGFPAASSCCPERPILVGSLSPTAEKAVLRPLAGVRGLAVLGWRDDDHVVVLRGSGLVQSVDVTTRRAVGLTRFAPGVMSSDPLLATELLAAPVVPGVRPQASDPRVGAGVAVGVAAVVLGVGYALLTWRRRRRGRA